MNVTQLVSTILPSIKKASDAHKVSIAVNLSLNGARSYGGRVWQHYRKYRFLARLVSNLRGIIVLVINSKHLVILKLKNISAIFLHANLHVLAVETSQVSIS